MRHQSKCQLHTDPPRALCQGTPQRTAVDRAKLRLGGKGRWIEALRHHTEQIGIWSGDVLGPKMPGTTLATTCATTPTAKGHDKMLTNVCESRSHLQSADPLVSQACASSLVAFSRSLSLSLSVTSLKLPPGRPQKLRTGVGGWSECACLVPCCATFPRRWAVLWEAGGCTPMCRTNRHWAHILQLSCCFQCFQAWRL